MRLHFEFTEADFADVAKRLALHAKTYRRFYWQEYAGAFLAAAFALFLAATGTIEQRLSLALFGAALFTLLHPSIMKLLYRGAHGDLMRRALGPDKPYVCEVELREEGVWCRQGRIQHIYEWSIVSDIKEMHDSVDILTMHGGGIVVRDRAFAAPDEKRAFIERAKELMNASRASSSVREPSQR